MENAWCPKKYNRPYPPHPTRQRDDGVCNQPEYDCIDSHRCPKYHGNVGMKNYRVIQPENTLENKDLKAKYDEMHRKGASSWFSDGREERELILKMGNPWKRLSVLEVGCGEGELAEEMHKRGAEVIGIDYSGEAIKKARQREKATLTFIYGNYRALKKGKFDRVVMQGVLEHLDSPFTELKWIMDNLLGDRGDIITSSPCFLNPRGIVWMTLDMLGAVMSKTDLHFLHPWEFRVFCLENGYPFVGKSCDQDWGEGEGMMADLKQRLPLALKDGNLPYQKGKVEGFLRWLKKGGFIAKRGATGVYRIIKEK